MKTYKGIQFLIIAIFILLSTSACTLVEDVLGAPTLPPTITMPALLPTEDVLQVTPVVPEATATMCIAAQPAPTSTATLENGMLRQWAAAAEASSEQSKDQSTAEQAVGQPDIQLTDGKCSDSPNAWAPASSESQAWIELNYEIPVFPSEVRVILTNAPGSVFPGGGKGPGWHFPHHLSEGSRKPGQRYLSL